MKIKESEIIEAHAKINSLMDEAYKTYEEMEEKIFSDKDQQKQRDFFHDYMLNTLDVGDVLNFLKKQGKLE
jgi:hypothetical protein